MRTAGFDMDKSKILPVVVVKDGDDIIKIMTALKKSGYKKAEITLRSKRSLNALKTAIESFPQMQVGAGTVINETQCLECIKCGAKFIVSPGLDEGVCALCKQYAVQYFPGCVTPTEIMRAISLGINTVKFFPASLCGGLRAIKALSAPFGDIKFIPTGGITRENVDEYLACDKIFAVGGSFFVEDALNEFTNNV